MSRLNEEFLNQYLSVPPKERSSDYILPLDKKMIERRLLVADSRLQGLAQDRAAIASQSGDSWHDGAFNENDRDKRITDREIANLKERLHNTEVDYPADTEDRVTLGSLAVLDFGGVETKIHVVGFSPVYESAQFASLETPIVQAIIGHKVGQVVMLQLRQTKEISILSIDQEALRLMDEDNDQQS